MYCSWDINISFCTLHMDVLISPYSTVGKLPSFAREVSGPRVEYFGTERAAARPTGSKAGGWVAGL